MKNIFKKISLILLASTALFAQIKAEDLQTTVDNLQIIIDNVNGINIPINAYAKRKTFQKIESTLKQLPEKIKASLQFSIANFKKHTTGENLEAVLRCLLDWQKPIRIKLMNQRENQEKTTWGKWASRASRGAAQLSNTAKYYGGRVASGVQWAATWPINTLFNATEAQKIKAAEALEKIEPQLEEKIAMEADARQRNDSESLNSFSQERYELNKQAAPYLIMLEEKYDWRKVAVYAGVATTAIIGCAAYNMTEQQRKAIWNDPVGAAKNAKDYVVNSYNSFKLPSLAEVQNYIAKQAQNVYEGTASKWQGFKRRASNYWYGSPATPNVQEKVNKILTETQREVDKFLIPRGEALENPIGRAFGFAEEPNTIEAAEKLRDKVRTAIEKLTKQEQAVGVFGKAFEGLQTGHEEAAGALGKAFGGIQKDQYEAAGAIGDFLRTTGTQLNQDLDREITNWAKRLKNRALPLSNEDRKTLNEYEIMLAVPFGTATNPMEKRMIFEKIAPKIENKLNSLLHENALMYRYEAEKAVDMEPYLFRNWFNRW